jgi:hypothetical protein
MWLALVLASLYPLHRLGLWMESKDWIYYQRRPKSGAGYFEAAGIFDPGMRHLREAKKEIVAERPDGDDDDARPPEDRVGPRDER